MFRFADLADGGVGMLSYSESYELSLLVRNNLADRYVLGIVGIGSIFRSCAFTNSMDARSGIENPVARCMA